VYSARGAVLGLVARRAEKLDALRACLGGEVETFPCDVRDARALKDAAGQFIGRRGIPDVVIANAGISHGGLTEIEEDLEVFRETFDINVLGVVNTFQPFAAPMRARSSGKLVAIASVAGFRGLPGASAYSAAKAAVIRYCEGLRVELHGSGVRVVTICPGFIDTPMTSRNPYPMPFILEVGDAARRIVRAIDSGTKYAVIPWQMAIFGRILSVLPNFVYDPLLAGRARKPRRG
jgi:NAD(P)-dependent dehydrogenase (short-subunit alcohol dehydrogenase family)